MLQIFVAESIEPLANQLAARLLVPSDNPFERELVAVPGGGLNRWIRLELARYLGAAPGRTDGITANIDVVFPGAIRSRLIGQDDDHSPSHAGEPWAIERLVWTVLRLIKDKANEPSLGALTDLPVGATWFGRARSIADLFDHYSVHRPAMLRSWHQDEDVDAAGEPLPPSQRWQPTLWRLVRRSIGSPSIAERLPGVLAELRSDPNAFVDKLPNRLSVFGVSSFPGGQEFIELIDALAVHRTVDVYLVTPSLPARAAEPTHPLLRTWAKQSHDTAQLARRNDLIEVQLDGSAHNHTTLLSQLQLDLRLNQQPTTSVRQDASLQLHECFGPVRQLEACRDAVLAALADDPSLEESDITILIPDLVNYAPLIASVFGQPAPSSGGFAAQQPGATPALRYVVTDRSLETSTDFESGVLALLRLLPGRFARSEVLDFLSQPAVSEMFGFDDESFATIDQWAIAGTIRWGLNPSHRLRWGIPASFTTNTWRDGVDQLLLGVAIFDDLPAIGPGDVVARGVEGNDVELLGRLAAVVDMLEQLVAGLDASRSVPEWTSWLSEALSSLLSTSADDEWQQDRVREVLHRLSDDASADGESPQISFPEFSQLLARSLRGTPGRNRFFAGGVTITSMQPMRWLPSRVTCIVGLDEAAFAVSGGTGDDLVAQHTMLGDIDQRSDRRQAVLEIILSTSDRLIITRTANNERTNATVPPAIAVAEFLDVIATMTDRSFKPLQHARQIFDPRHLSPTALALATFDQRATAAATARANQDHATQWITEPLAPMALPDLSLAQLRSFLAGPTRSFLTTRLNVRLTTAQETPSENLSTSLDSLENWKLTDELLNATIDAEDWAYFHARAGDLPAGIAADAKLLELEASAAMLKDLAAEAFTPGIPADPLDVDLTVSDTRLIGVVDHIVQSEVGLGLLRLTNSKMSPKLILPLWLDLIVATIQAPENEWRATLVAKSASSSKKTPIVQLNLEIAGESPAQRTEHASLALATMLDLYQRGQCEPLPLFPKTSGGVYFDKHASDAWSAYAIPGESDDVYNAEVWGSHSFDSLIEMEVHPNDPDGAGQSRLSRYANILWNAVQTSLKEPIVV